MLEPCALKGDIKVVRKAGGNMVVDGGLDLFLWPCKYKKNEL